MSKNRYRLPFLGTWYIEYGGTTRKTSHSWHIPGQRYAYDFEIRKNNLPYHDDQTKCKNYYSYLENIYAPADGWVVDLVNNYENTHITKDRKIINDYLKNEITKLANSLPKHIIIPYDNIRKKDYPTT